MCDCRPFYCPLFLAQKHLISLLLQREARVLSSCGYCWTFLMSTTGQYNTIQRSNPVLTLVALQEKKSFVSFGKNILISSKNPETQEWCNLDQKGIQTRKTTRDEIPCSLYTQYSCNTLLDYIIYDYSLACNTPYSHVPSAFSVCWIIYYKILQKIYTVYLALFPHPCTFLACYCKWRKARQECGNKATMYQPSTQGFSYM